MINVALFDLDGTLLNTYESIFQAYKYSLKKNKNIDFAEKDFKKILGPPLEECYQIITNLKDVKQLYYDHVAFQESNLHLSTLYPEVKETLARLKRKGIKIGLVTARAAKTLTKILEITQLSKYMDVIIDADSVTKHKPHPEALLKALQILKAKPQNAIMIGDLQIDILAGKNAGIKTIGVTYGFIGKRIARANPDYIINDISEIPSMEFFIQT